MDTWESSGSEGNTRKVLLDVTERLISQKGYAGTSVSAICKAAGVAATSLYWHYGSKEGLLAAVVKRGAERWFAALPSWGRLSGDVEERAEAVVLYGADAVATYPAFLRMFYLLALEKHDNEVVAKLIREVREFAIDYFQDVIAGLLAEEEPSVARGAAAELAPFAVAYSDGCFFAAQLDPEADLARMYTDLLVALRALAPAAVERAKGAGE
jgi:AcrR family transcriptional regulator